MKKILGFMLAGMLVFGGASLAFADEAPACTGPVSTDCDNDEDGDIDCNVYVAVEGADAICVAL